VAAIAPDRPHDRVQHILISKRLGKEIHGASFHGLYRHRNIAMPGHEDDRNVNACFGELALNVQPALSREPDVEHETARNIRQLGLQQLPCRAEGFSTHTDRPK
jgi:predicted NUDIX family phosphoesterase